MSWSMHHAKSEKYASLAEAASKESDFERAVELYRLAAEEEVLALTDLGKHKRRTLGITVVSAASLWYKTGDLHQAQNLAKQWLNTELLPVFAINQLQDLLNTISNESTPAKTPIESPEDESSLTEPERIKILLLAANPLEVTSLRLDEEAQTIDQQIRQTEFQDLFDIKRRSSVRIEELPGLLLRHKPTIVHFSGHGSMSSEIVLENKLGHSQPVSARVLSDIFSKLTQNIYCVMLNGCYSEPQAQAIAEQVECVIGMSKAIGDSSSITFASSFYKALGFGRSVKNAFDLACNELNRHNLSEKDTPKLFAFNTDPEEIILAGSDMLSRALIGGSDRRRLRVAQELTSIPQMHLIAVLIERSSTEPDPTVRYWINVALGKVGSVKAIEALRRNLKDPNPFALLGVQDALKEHEEKVDTGRKKPPPLIKEEWFQSVSQLRYVSVILARGARSSTFPDSKLREKVDALNQVKVHWKTVRREANHDVVFMVSVFTENGWINVWTRCGIPKGMDMIGERKGQTLEQLVQDVRDEVRHEQAETGEREDLPVFEPVTIDVLAAYDRKPETLVRVNISG